MRPRFKVSRTGLELIKGFEGLRRRAARLPDGRWTIGYGHTLSAREGAEVSPEDAEALLLFDLLPVVAAVNDLVTVELVQHQFDALAAFAFNIGVEAFAGSDVLKRVNEARFTEAALALEVWRNTRFDGRSVTLDALVRRRAAEAALFLGETPWPMPTPRELLRPMIDSAAAAGLPARPPARAEVDLDGETASVRLYEELVAEPETPVESSEAPSPDSGPPPAPDSDDRPEPAAAPESDGFTTAQAEAVARLLTPGAAEESAAEASPVLAAPPDAPAEAEPKPEPERETTPAPQPEPRPVVAPDVAPEPEPAVESPTATQPQSDLEPGSRTAPAPDFQPEPPSLQPAHKPGATPAVAALSLRLHAPYGPSALGAASPFDVREATGAEPDPTERPGDEAAAEAAPPLALTSEAAAPPAVLVLTPPDDEPETSTDEAGETAAAAHAPDAEAAPAAGGAEVEDSAPLFGALGHAEPGRIIAHEDIAPESPRQRLSDTGAFVAMGAVGLGALAASVGAFRMAAASPPPTGALDEKTGIAWALALIGALLIGLAVYPLFKRMGGLED